MQSFIYSITFKLPHLLFTYAVKDVSLILFFFKSCLIYIVFSVKSIPRTTTWYENVYVTNAVIKKLRKISDILTSLSRDLSITHRNTSTFSFFLHDKINNGRSQLRLKQYQKVLKRQKCDILRKKIPLNLN